MKKYGLSLPRAGKRLEKLLEECLNLSKPDDIIADVGSDHGYLAIMLAKSGKYKAVIATDISKPSLDKTIALAVNQKTDVICKIGDGLLPAPEANIAAICGMGGQEIIKILTSSPNIKRLVLQPVQNHIELRQFLIKNKYKIIKDYCIEDQGKFYYIIVTSGHGKNFYTKTQKLFGKNPKTSTDFTNYLIKEKNLLSFLENFDITKVTNVKEVKQKQNYYNLCKKLISKRK